MSVSSLALAAPNIRLAPNPVRPRRLVRSLAAAVALHLALVALLVVAIRPHALTEPQEAPAFTMVFAPAVSPETPPEPQPPEPAAESEPPLPITAEPPEAEAPPPPAEATAPAAEVPPSEPPPSPALAEPAPPPSPPPVATQPAPEPPPHPAPVRPQRPVTPPRREIVRPRPAPPRPAVQAPRVPKAPSISAVPYEPTTPAPTPVARPAPAPASAAAAPAISAAWNSAVIAWLKRNQKYPEAALEEGVEGRPSIHFTVARDGQVLDVTLVRPSGSRVLDEAAVALVRGAHLPPFPASMASATVGVTQPINYNLP